MLIEYLRYLNIFLHFYSLQTVPQDMTRNVKIGTGVAVQTLNVIEFSSRPQ